MTRRAKQAEDFKHGDARRYRRGCRCRACMTAVTAEVRIGRYLRETGRGRLTTTDRAADHIERLRAAGMPDFETRADALVGPDVFYRILRREGGIHRTTEARILAVKPRPTKLQGHGERIPGIGTFRRLRALAADGWTATELGLRCNKHKQYIVHLQKQNDDVLVRAWVAKYVADVYRKTAGAKPEHHGIPAHIAERTRQAAAQKGWAPTRTWDDETLDDPNAQPDWTGACGTDRGWWMHKSEDIPFCQPCESAHAVWLAERKHLQPAERFRQLAAARSGAARREVDLATDARELMRVSGLDHQQAADRLGVTKAHLHQALVRNPDPTTVKEAA